MSEFVVMENVKKTYKMGEVMIHAVDGVDIEIHKGEFAVIVGPSGAGKTTVLNMLGGMDRVTSGKVIVDGRDISLYNSRQLTKYRRDDIGFVFQFHHLLAEFTALENVMMPMLIAGKGDKEARLRGEELLKMVGMEHRMAHKPSALSGGEQQRVAIARALANNPSVVLADEPTGNLDSVTREEIQQLFIDLRNRTGQTFIIVTHDQTLAACSDRQIVMSDGRIVE